MFQNEYKISPPVRARFRKRAHFAGSLKDKYRGNPLGTLIRHSMSNRLYINSKKKGSRPYPFLLELLTFLMHSARTYNHLGEIWQRVTTPVRSLVPLHKASITTRPFQSILQPEDPFTSPLGHFEQNGTGMFQIIFSLNTNIKQDEVNNDTEAVLKHSIKSMCSFQA